MTAALWFISTLATFTLGWQGARTATASSARRAGGPRRGRLVSPAPGPELDLTDHAKAQPPGGLYDWRASEPGIARCDVCRNKGRVWSIDGYGHRCPCGAPVAHHKAAAR